MGRCDSIRSPLLGSLLEFVKRFATTPERLSIAVGLLNFRAELHKIGIVDGQQWLDGSYVENIELLESRPPRDIDVVTFFLASSESYDILELRDDLVVVSDTKQRYQVDNYLVNLAFPQINTVRTTAYWYGLWSHKRSGDWKGFIEIDLAPDDDEAARDVVMGLLLEITKPVDLLLEITKPVDPMRAPS